MTPETPIYRSEFRYGIRPRSSDEVLDIDRRFRDTLSGQGEVLVWDGPDVLVQADLANGMGAQYMGFASLHGSPAATLTVWQPDLLVPRNMQAFLEGIGDRVIHAPEQYVPLRTLPLQEILAREQAEFHHLRAPTDDELLVPFFNNHPRTYWTDLGEQPGGSKQCL